MANMEGIVVMVAPSPDMIVVDSVEYDQPGRIVVLVKADVALLRSTDFVLVTVSVQQKARAKRHKVFFFHIKIKTIGRPTFQDV